MKCLTNLSLIGTFLLSTTAFAAPAFERLVLTFNNAHYQPRALLKLKQKIRQQYPAFNLTGYKLLSAKLVAKTRHGAGKAYLRVGSATTAARTIGGQPATFNGRRNYKREVFQNPNNFNVSAGKWQFKLRGNFKVKKVVLRLKRPAPMLFVENLDTIKSEKWLTWDYVSVGRPRVKKLILKGSRRTTKIKEVIVTFGNGNSRRMFALEGKLEEGQTKRVNFAATNGRYIREIAIFSRSKKLFGHRAKFQVKIAKKP